MLPPAACRVAVAVLVSLFLTSALAAKPSKRSKEGKKGSDPDVVLVNLIRPENAGMMNLIPAHVVLEPGSDILSARVTHLRPSGKKEPRGLVLVGGDAAALSLRPGTYSIQVRTPVAEQPPEGYPRGKRHVWKSPPVKMVLSLGETICLVVEPGIAGTEYDGSWTIAKAVSPADCGPMTKTVAPDDGDAKP